jgi:perosamine synthetase
MSLPLFDARVAVSGQTAAAAVLASGHIAHGRHVTALEAVMNTYLPTHEGVTFANMTVALETALRLCDIGPDNEVLTLAFNCLSSNVAIHNAGARPVWVDLDPETGSMNIEDARAQITARTKAIIVYHIAGYPSDSVALRALCDEHGLFLIEDANAAYGARLPNGKPVGSFGDFTVFSFYANRQINAAEGAILMCRDHDMAQRATRHRRFGIDIPHFRDSRGEIDPHADVTRIGVAGSLSNLNAAIAMNSVRSVDARLAKVEQNARALTEGLTSACNIRAVTPMTGSKSVYWVFMILVQHQDAVLDRLTDKNVGRTKLHQSNQIYSGFGANQRPLPATEDFSARMIGLPVGWWLEPSQIDQILDALRPA